LVDARGVELPNLACFPPVRLGQLTTRWPGELQRKHSRTGADLGVTIIDPGLTTSDFCPAWGGSPWFSDLWWYTRGTSLGDLLLGFTPPPLPALTAVLLLLGGAMPAV